MENNIENANVWTDGIEQALHEIRSNAVINSDYHTNNYYGLKSYLKYFRVPTIILSGMNSVFSVGLQPYMSQGIISVLCCSISLTCGIIASVELFLGIQDMMEKELVSSKEFYILSSDIFKTLSIERQYRLTNGKTYLDNIHMKYCNLIEQGNLLDTNNQPKNTIQLGELSESYDPSAIRSIMDIDLSDIYKNGQMQEEGEEPIQGSFWDIFEELPQISNEPIRENNPHIYAQNTYRFIRNKPSLRKIQYAGSDSNAKPESNADDNV
jgi:hypothetical protein